VFAIVYDCNAKRSSVVWVAAGGFHPSCLDGLNKSGDLAQAVQTGWGLRPDCTHREKNMAEILIIDDNHELQEVLTDYLESDSHQVVSASDGTSAKALLPTINPDIVFLDVGLPDASGLELLPHIKNLHPGACVIIITGIDDYRVEDLMFEAGADHFITKPFHREDIMDRVRKLLV
jgi:CheY-like chemotaxis protein